MGKDGLYDLQIQILYAYILNVCVTDKHTDVDNLCLNMVLTRRSWYK